MRKSKRAMFLIISMIAGFALWVSIGLQLDKTLSYYVLGVIVILSVYAAYSQFQAGRNKKNLKQLRDELLDARWQEENSELPK